MVNDKEWDERTIKEKEEAYKTLLSIMKGNHNQAMKTIEEKPANIPTNYQFSHYILRLDNTQINTPRVEEVYERIVNSDTVYSLEVTAILKQKFNFGKPINTPILYINKSENSKFMSGDAVKTIDFDEFNKTLYSYTL